MADANIIRVDQINSSGTEREILVPILAASVITGFKAKTIMEDKHEVKPITAGASLQINVLGHAKAGFVDYGTDVLVKANGVLSESNSNKVIINLDKALVSAVLVDGQVEEESQTDALSKVAVEMGEAMAVENDRRVMQMAILGARASKFIADKSGYRSFFDGTVLEKGATLATSADVLRAAIIEATTVLAEHDIDSMSAFCILKPAAFSLLLSDVARIGATWNQDEFTKRRVLNINGLEVHESNLLPTSNISAVTGEMNTYAGDFSDTVGFVGIKSAVAEVRLRGIEFAKDRIPQFMSDLLLAKQKNGYGFLRPEALIELSKASAS